MRLEIGKINITDLRFAEESKVEGGGLYVNAEDFKPVVLEDEKIKDVSFDIAKPGESVRITPVKDVIEPRVKVRQRRSIPGLGFQGRHSRIRQDSCTEGNGSCISG